MDIKVYRDVALHVEWVVRLRDDRLGARSWSSQKVASLRLSIDSITGVLELLYHIINLGSTAPSLLINISRVGTFLIFRGRHIVARGIVRLGPVWRQTTRFGSTTELRSYERFVLLGLAEAWLQFTSIDTSIHSQSLFSFLYPFLQCILLVITILFNDLDNFLSFFLLNLYLSFV